MSTKIQTLLPLSLIFLTTTHAALATPTDPNWIDHTHQTTSEKIDHLANNMNNWFGSSTEDQPADATLRIIFDTSWDKYDGTSFHPKIRGRLRLPTLENKLSLIFGDDSSDNEYSNNAHIEADGRLKRTNNNHFDRKRSREDNSALALRWSDISQKWDIDSDLDIGIRSGTDLYLRGKLSKSWQLDNDYSARIEQIYRYGIKSKHYARSNFEIKKATKDRPIIADQLHITYQKDNDEQWTWGNSLYRQHHFSNNKTLNYGLYAGGDIANKKTTLNSYGPFISMRQPLWRKWFFIETEANYYNDKKAEQKHHLGGLLRLEAIF